MPNTGSHANWQTVNSSLTLAAGAHTLRVVIEAGDPNLNKFTFTAAGASGGAPVSGQIYRLVARHSGQVLEVGNCSQAVGANVQQGPWLGSGCQRWKVEATTSGYYTLKAQHSGQVLDLKGCSGLDGANVQQWAVNGTPCQEWRIEPTDGGYCKLLSLSSGKALDVGGFSTANGANVQQWTYGGGANQQWKFELVGATRAALATATGPASAAPALRLAPNPASDFVDLAWTGPEGSDVTLSLVNMQGQLVRQQVVHGSAHHLNTVGLRQGLYLVKVQAGSTATTQKLVVQ